MTRISSTSLKALLLMACSALYSGLAVAVPDIWETKLGATVTTAAVPAMDNVDNADTGIALSFDTMSFPFGTTTYTGTAILNISSNGFISLGGSNGSDPVASGNTLITDDFPRIAPFWTDLVPDMGGDVFINRFNDDQDTAIDRIVITFASANLNTCMSTNNECAILVQVQLLENGTIIFGYNGVDLDQPANTVTNNLLIGIAPAVGATVADPGSRDLNAGLPYGIASGDAVYQLFTAAIDPFDLDDSNLVFIPTPVLGGGFAVADNMLNPPVSTAPQFWETRIGTTVDGQALDNVDDGTVNLTFGTISFPFPGGPYTAADILNISSNGFISLGGSNGPDPLPSAALLTGGIYPRIAPFWTDLDPGAQGGDIFINRFFGDPPVPVDRTDALAPVDRIVITFALGHNQCNADECSALAQVQLLDNGDIIFGYNGIDLVNALNNVSRDLLVGLSPGTGANDLGSTDISVTGSSNISAGDAYYELFKAASAPRFDLDGGNVKFTPDGGGGFDVTAPGVSGAAIGFIAKGSGSSGHCSLAGKDAPFEPTLWLLVLVSVFYLLRRRTRTEPTVRAK